MIDYTSQESSILDGDLLIGDFVVRPVLKTVRPASSPKGSNERSLPDKAIAVLLYLAQNARQVCERDDILDTVWGEDRDAYDRVLDNAVTEIRRVLNDDARDPKYIQTVPRRGYRLLVPVHERVSRVVPRPGSESGNPGPTDLRDPTAKSTPPAETHSLDSESPDSSAPDPSTQDVAPVVETEPPATTVRSRRSPLHRLSLGIAVAVLALAAVGVASSVWLWPSAHAVRIEVRPAAPQSAAEVELASRVRQSLFGDHPCGEQRLVRPPAGIFPADLTLTASVEQADGRTMLRIRHSDPSIPAVLAQLDRGDERDIGRSGIGGDADLGRFLTNVSAMIDRQICFERGLPESRRACHCRAASTRTFHKMGQPAPHIELLGQAIVLAPSEVDSYEALAIVYRSLGDVESARSTLTAGLAKIDDPASVSALILRRRLAEMLGDFEAEGEIIHQLRNLRADEPRWKLAAAAHLARHQRDCAKALTLIADLGDDPIPPEATHLEDSESVWTCLLHSDRQEEARRRLAQAPQDAGTRFQLALGSVLSGHLDEARHLANEYLALQPDSADAYWLLASIEGRQGAYTATRHWMAQMKELTEWPNQDLRYLTTMGWTDLRDGHAAECVERFADMPEGSRPWSTMARWTLGRCQIQSGDLEAAHQTVAELRQTQAVTRSRWQEEFVLHLEARLTAAESDEPEAPLRAAEQMIQAVELGPTDFPYFATEAGVLLEQAGDLERAREFYQRAVAYSPTYPWGNCHLGLLYRRLDRDAEAVTHLRRALDVFGDPPEGPLGQRCVDELRRLEDVANSEG